MELALTRVQKVLAEALYGIAAVIADSSSLETRNTDWQARKPVTLSDRRVGSAIDGVLNHDDLIAPEVGFPELTPD